MPDTAAKLAALKATFDLSQDYAVAKALRGETLSEHEFARGTAGIPTAAFVPVDGGWKLSPEALAVVEAA
jgi:hypothetical protein